MKVDLEGASAANRGDFTGILEIRDVVATSRESPFVWKYTFESPSGSGRWHAADFDDSDWKEGPGVFGAEGTPGASVRTTWNTPDIWARRAFTLPEVDTRSLLISALHDEDADFYLNGVLAARVNGHRISYDDMHISSKDRATLMPGRNAIAVHCHQTGGGQSIDAGLVE